MAAPEHRFTRNPPGLARMKVRGGRAFGCTCGAMTFASLRDAVLWHARHKTEEASPARQLDRMREQLAELQGKLTALVGV